MNTVQAIDYLLKNELSSFISKDAIPQGVILQNVLPGGPKCYMRMDERGIVACDSEGNFIAIFALSQIKLSMQWEVVKKPVDFIAAMNSGKCVKPKGYIGPCISANYWIGCHHLHHLTMEMINGEWEIGD